MVADALGADLAAVYLVPDQPPAPPTWRLGAFHGGDEQTLTLLPNALGSGAGILAPLFQNSSEVRESTQLDGMPMCCLVGVPLRRRDRRLVGALLIGSREESAFDDAAVATFRSMAQLLGVALDNARLAVGYQRERRLVVESQATLGTVLESVGSGVCVVELDGMVRMANKRFLDLFGIAGPVAGRLEDEVFATASTKPREWDEFLRGLREMRSDPSQLDETEWDIATEPPRVIQRYSAPMRSAGGNIVGRVDVYTDITESRRLYTQLLNSEKLRAIGEMASGVAHDFNNLLASILGQVELLHPDELPPATREAIGTIRQSALDGARIVRNLQGLARPRLETPSTTADLNEAVRAALDMARPRFASATLQGQGAIDVSLDLTEGPALARVAIDPAELREVLLNLLFNAADAMPDGGGIEIVTRPGQKPRTADLVVRDTGQGMPESVRARIFEPFFSTKGPKGSGLGLAVAYSVITRRGGLISVESVPDQGTVFTINLPFVPIGAPSLPATLPSMASPKRAEPAKPAGAGIRGARILVADDEPGLVTIVSQLLERSGAQVSIANGGSAAIEALKAARPPDTFDVVVTDLDMPEVDGWAVTSAVKTLSPGTHVVMLTGWAGEVTPDDFKRRGVDVVMSKPCSRAELESAIGGLLTPPVATGFDVLLVDDEPAFARAVRDMLTLQGHRVMVVESAGTALETLDGRSFDVILTDYSLGEVTGAELAERLADRGTSAYVVLITGYATEIDDPSLLTRGVNAVLPKPCRGDDLRAVLSRI